MKYKDLPKVHCEDCIWYCGTSDMADLKKKYGKPEKTLGFCTKENIKFLRLNYYCVQCSSFVDANLQKLANS